ncbi:MAG TPA: hypothetical protein VF250_11950 [Conexibacter sp.]
MSIRSEPVVQIDTPDWAPLEAAIGPKLTGWFMWMHEIRLIGGPSVHAYKHIATRRYLHLAGDGRAFIYLGDGSYRATPLDAALATAFSR